MGAPPQVTLIQHLPRWDVQGSHRGHGSSLETHQGCCVLEQWFSSFRVHQNDPEGLVILTQQVWGGA